MNRSFSSSRLLRQLAAWPDLAVQPSRQDWAERLGLWINPTDAIALHATHQAARAEAAPVRTAQRAETVEGLVQQVRRVRGDLLRLIEATALRPAGSGGAAVGAGELPAWTPYRQFFFDRQRDMEAKVTALRGEARRVLAGVSPRLRQLAVLDAALERALGVREQKLLARLPGLLEGRFRQLRDAGRGFDDPTDPGVDGSALRGAPVWEEQFCREMRELLQSELQVRMEPVMGLVEAGAREVKE